MFFYRSAQCSCCVIRLLTWRVGIILLLMILLSVRRIGRLVGTISTVQLDTVVLVQVVLSVVRIQRIQLVQTRLPVGQTYREGERQRFLFFGPEEAAALDS